MAISSITGRSDDDELTRAYVVSLIASSILALLFRVLSRSPDIAYGASL